jgi:ABC-type Fe3+ transport system substrate-binding protein
MLGVVPAVFLVNKDMLGDRPLPKSWKELLTPEFEKSVSLPISDFDLFNSILININKNYGEEGVKSLGRHFLKIFILHRW